MEQLEVDGLIHLMDRGVTWLQGFLPVSQGSWLPVLLPCLLETWLPVLLPFPLESWLPALLLDLQLTFLPMLHLLATCWMLIVGRQVERQTLIDGVRALQTRDR